MTSRSSFEKSFYATAAFAVVHSALASLTAKRIAERVAGTRNRDGLYRAFFLAQSLVTFAALAAYISSLREEKIYELEGQARIRCRAGQAVMLGFLSWAALSAGLLRLTGLEQYLAWRKGVAVPATPVAQGPEPSENGELSASGPFRRQRHPLNFGFLPIFWLAPKLTTRRLGFNVSASLYLLIGSFLEEARLRRGHGKRYEQYRSSGPNFFLPRLTPREAAPIKLLGAHGLKKGKKS